LCVEDYADSIFRFVKKNLRDEHRAEDITQDTFTKMWEKHETVNYAKAKSYLYTTAYHTMLDIIKKNKRLSIEEEIETTSRTFNQYSDLSEVLEKAIQRLPSSQRSSLMLRDYEGYSYKEIEEITGLKQSQVKVYIYRARKNLKEYIGSIENVI
jgi:RNA polymerase sigma factor (sigma-70 family)